MLVCRPIDVVEGGLNGTFFEYAGELGFKVLHVVAELHNRHNAGDLISQFILPELFEPLVVVLSLLRIRVFLTKLLTDIFVDGIINEGHNVFSPAQRA